MPESDLGDSASDDAPETFSLVQSRRTVETQDDALQEFRAAMRLKQKQRNRERDLKMKKRAETRRKPSVKVDDDVVQARMARVMQDAEEEEMDDEDRSVRCKIGRWEMLKTRGNDRSDSQDSEDVELTGGEGDSTLSNDDDSEYQDESISRSTAVNPDRHSKLPDHLFTSAFTKEARSSTKQRSSADTSVKKKPNRRRVRTKDLILG